MNRSRRLTVLLGLISLAGCATSTPIDITANATQLEMRQIQTRTYDTLNKAMTMRSVIATLQDLGFTSHQADAELGAVTATRLHDYTMRMTVTAVKKEGGQISVRANARIGEKPVTDAATYQDFFVVLDTAMFLTMHEVD